MANLENYKAMGEGFNPYAMRNKLINGEVTRINQRNFNGSSWVNGVYAYDRWKATSTAMTQIIEDGNYTPNTTHTLSGNGVTTQQLTSPASGHWTLPDIPRTARNIQLEEGSTATPFEVRPIGMELSLCQRYYYETAERIFLFPTSGAADTTARKGFFKLPVTMRVDPAISNITSTSGTAAALDSYVDYCTFDSTAATGGSYDRVLTVNFDAEL